MKKKMYVVLVFIVIFSIILQNYHIKAVNAEDVKVTTLVAEIDKVYQCLSDEDKRNISDVRAKINQENYINWDTIIIPTILTDEVIGRLGGAFIDNDGKEASKAKAKDKIKGFIKDIISIAYRDYYASPIDTLNKVRTTNSQDFHALFGDDITLNDVFQLVVNGKADLTSVLKRHMDWTGILVHGSYDDIIDILPNLFKAGLDDVLTDAYKQKLNALGWTSLSPFIDMMNNAIAQADPTHAAQKSLVRAVIRSQSTLKVNKNIVARGDVINISSSSAICNLEILGYDISSQVKWVSSNLNVADFINKDPEDGDNLIPINSLSIKQSGPTTVSVYRYTGDNYTDPSSPDDMIIGPITLNVSYIPAAISNVSAINGKVNITLEKVPTDAPSAGNFTITSTIDNGSPNMLALTNFVWDPSTRTVSYDFPAIAQTTVDQSVVIGVTYKNATTPVNAPSFTLIGVPKDYRYSVSGDEIIITGYTGSGGNITIPASIDGHSVTSIDNSAFSDCTSLTSVIIPNSVTSIGSYAFSSCTSLTSVIIPDSVTSMGDGAFCYCHNLKSITIPSSLNSIGDWMFCDCTSLTSVSIPSGVTTIGNCTFSWCSNLTNINIPNSVTSIGSNAFACTNLMSITIPDSITSIGDSFLSNCTRLTSIVIPNSVTNIGCNAFASCTNLASITIPNSVISIGGSAFAGCTKLTNINIPNSVTSIGDYAFANCTFTNINIPNSVTSIGNGVFNYCENLRSITIPSGLNSIGNYLFYHCTSLTSVTIPNGVTGIGDRAFMWCSNITNINIPNSVISIGSEAFSVCTSLNNITIPASVTSIGIYAFCMCNSLKNIDVDTGNEMYISIDGILYNKQQTTLICYPAAKPDLLFTVPRSVISIGERAFYYCNSITSVTISNNNTSIGQGAFEYCNNLTSVNIGNDVNSSTNLKTSRNITNLTSIKTSSIVSTIGEYAFYNCTNLTEAKFFGNAPTMDSNVFDNCSTGFKVYYHAGALGFTNPWYGYPTEPFYTVTYDGNGSTNETYLTDNNTYLQGGAVTVLDNTGLLTKAGFTFVGWNSKSDGSGTDYAEGATFTMGTDNVILYANWIEDRDIESVILNKPETTIKAGDNEILTATVTPADATDNTVKWSVTDGSDVVSVSPSGLVTAINVGTAVVRVTSNADSTKYAECRILVIPKEIVTPKIILPNTSITIGNSLTIKTDLDSTIYLVPSDTGKNRIDIINNRKAKLTVRANTEAKLYVSGLDPGKTYVLYAIDASGNISDPSPQIKFTIDECFIATAAYGSKYMPAVVLLRHFRDDYLLTNPLGRKFVKFYYKNSPSIAEFIAGNNNLRLIVRILLTPLIVLVYTLYHPYIILILLLLVYIIKRKRRNSLSM